MTGDRWDTREHRDDDPERQQPNGKPYGPWHDATSALEGPAAAALGELARDRWQRAGGAALAAVPATNCWPDALRPQFHDADVAIARTAPELGDRPALHEIERLYCDQLAAARRFVYIENQYFASRLIARAIASRLAEIDGPEIVVINPERAQGWLEPLAMDTTRARLYEASRVHRKLRASPARAPDDDLRPVDLSQAARDRCRDEARGEVLVLDVDEAPGRSELIATELSSDC